jgi:hypothetical protein
LNSASQRHSETGIKFDLKNNEDILKYKEAQKRFRSLNAGKPNTPSEDVLRNVSLDLANVTLFSGNYKGNWIPSKSSGMHWAYLKNLDVDMIRGIDVSNVLIEEIKFKPRQPKEQTSRIILASILCNTEDAYVQSITYLFRYYVSELLGHSESDAKNILTPNLSRFFVACEHLISTHIDLRDSLNVEIHHIEENPESLSFAECLSKIIICLKFFIEYVRYRIQAMESLGNAKFKNYLQKKRFENANAPEFDVLFNIPVKRIQQYLPILYEYVKYSASEQERKIVQNVIDSSLDSLQSIGKICELSVLESRFLEFNYNIPLTSMNCNLLLKADLLCLYRVIPEKFVYFIFDSFILETWGFRVLRKLEKDKFKFARILVEGSSQALNITDPLEIVIRSASEEILIHVKAKNEKQKEALVSVLSNQIISSS